ncbi:MAG TPA: hypothetical protein VFH51_11400, partial [Myxococcota bacterium]|nr:hypothetical protein [Myxococcota bacterium]
LDAGLEMAAAENAARGYYGDIQLDGFEQLTTRVMIGGRTEERFITPGALNYAISHTRDRVDANLMSVLLRHAPKSADGHRIEPNSIMRQGDALSERVVTNVLAKRFFTLYETDSQAPKDETPKQLAARRQRNTRVSELAYKKPKHGFHTLLFPQGTVRGDGTVLVEKTGGLTSLSKVGEASVPFVPVGITYDGLTYAKPKAIVSIRPPVVLRDFDLPDFAGQTPEAVDKAKRRRLAEAMQGELVLANSLTVTGIVGAWWLMARARGREPEALFEAQVNALVTHVVESLRREAPELSVDFDLIAPSVRRERVTTFMRSLSTPRPYFDRNARASATVEPYLTEAGTVRRRPGAAADLAAPIPFGERPEQLDQTDPLRYWGNRTRQHAALCPALHGLFERAFTAPLVGSGPEAPLPRAEGCTVM